MYAAIGKNVVAPVGFIARAGASRTSEKSDVPPPISTISTSCSRSMRDS